ncbi:MAG: hypothetical protein IJY28_01540, partial [Clostridia bacterium]|nr:hypothetical protein [Clostridia bacterium]
MNTFYAYQWDTSYTVAVPWDEDSIPYMDFVRRWADDSRGTITPTLADGTLTATCPPELLTAPGEIAVYLRDENTRQQAAILIVQPRAKPDDYLYTPAERWTAEKAVDKALQAAYDSGMFTGPTGPVGPQGPKGDAYTLTDADKAEIAEQVEGAVLVQAPKYVDSVDQMTDTSRVYVLASTGEIWAYMDTTTEQEVTIREDITGTTDNPYEVGRLSSSGTLGEAVTGYVITPYIDLTKAEYAGKTIELHLDGNRYVSETAETYIQMAIFKTDKTVLYGRASTCLDKNAAILPVLTNVTTTIHGETSATLTITIPA